MRNKTKQRQKGDEEATRLFQLLSVDQVLRAAVAFRAVTGSPPGRRNRFYLKAGRCAWLAIRWRNEKDILPKDILRFLAGKGRAENEGISENKERKSNNRAAV